MNPPYKFSALQGWRHGVHSRSHGGTFYIPSRNRVQEVSRPAGWKLVISVALWCFLSVCRRRYHQPGCQSVRTLQVVSINTDNDHRDGRMQPG